MTDVDYDKRSKSEYELEQVSVRQLVSTEQGRRVVWSMLSYAGTFRDTFDADPIKHAYAAGARAHGLHFSNLIKEHAPESWLKMLRENECV